jgi:HAD superfamily hydrolase (TIGR01457 family)
VPNPSSIYVFDLDGVMYLGDTAIPHATEAVRKLSDAGNRVYYLTNNSGRTRRSYQDKLRTVNGLDVPLDRIFTSAYATALYLRHPGSERHTAFVIGEPGLAQELEEVGNLKVFTIPDSAAPKDIHYVIVGIDRQFSYDKLRFAHAAIVRGGAQFIATNRDATFPTELGEIPGGGSLVAAVAECTGHVPITIGKPEPHALEAILRSAGVSATDCTVVGDRLDTDIAVGKRVGADTVLVLTGVTSRETAESAPDQWRPDKIIGDLRELV